MCWYAEGDDGSVSVVYIQWVYSGELLDPKGVVMDVAGKKWEDFELRRVGILMRPRGLAGGPIRR